MSGLPGLRRLDHIGITVPDLEEATAFFLDVLGCEYMYSLGPFRDDAGDWMQVQLGVDPRTVMNQLHFFRCGGAAVFEVFEYTAPEQRTVPPLNSDVGGHHVALYVDDLDTAVAHLRERGVRIFGEPTASKARARDNGGSTSSRHGGCSSSWCPTPAARPSIGNRNPRATDQTPRELELPVARGSSVISAARRAKC
jgi:catechol 2,3-dioxygenase-like lactoylglutathione lyase family enzyme